MASNVRGWFAMSVLAGERWGEWLSSQLADRQWRQSDLIKASNDRLARQSVSKWVNGDNSADADAAITVAKALKADPIEALRAAGHQRIADLLFTADPADGQSPRRQGTGGYQMIIPDVDRKPGLGFRGGSWYWLQGDHPRLSLLDAIKHSPHAAGPIIQLSFGWMRKNPLSLQSETLATELTLAVEALVRLVSFADFAFVPPQRAIEAEDPDTNS